MSDFPRPYIVVWELHGKGGKSSTTSTLNRMRSLLLSPSLSSSSASAAAQTVSAAQYQQLRPISQRAPSFSTISTTANTVVPHRASSTSGRPPLPAPPTPPRKGNRSMSAGSEPLPASPSLSSTLSPEHFDISLKSPRSPQRSFDANESSAGDRDHDDHITTTATANSDAGDENMRVANLSDMQQETNGPTPQPNTSPSSKRHETPNSSAGTPNDAETRMEPWEERDIGDQAKSHNDDRFSNDEAVHYNNDGGDDDKISLTRSISTDYTDEVSSTTSQTLSSFSSSTQEQKIVTTPHTPTHTSAQSRTMQPHSIQATSSFPSALDMSFPIWTNSIEPILRGLCCPLNLARYKPKNPIAQNNVYLSQIGTVDVDFLLANDPRAVTTRHWSKWFQSPYLHLLIVQADTVDDYRNQIRPALRDLVKQLQDKDYEYQIVYIPSESKKKILLSNAYDRLRSEFNDKKDRVMKLIIDSKTSSKRDESFLELEERIKEGLVLEFVSRSNRYEQEIKKFLSNRTLPGWHYCPYFIIKEGLAFVLEQFGLIVNALSIYKELKSFVKNEDISFDKFIDPGDRFITKILDISAKPYWQKIYENNISEFDFSNYLLARQFALYFKLGVPDEAAKYAVYYITKMVVRMERQLLQSIQTRTRSKTQTEPQKQQQQQQQQQHQEEDEDYAYVVNYAYIHFWGFCAAICVVEACQKRAFDADPDTLMTLCKILGDLYIFAQYRLQVLCKLFGLQLQWESFRVSGDHEISPSGTSKRLHPPSMDPALSQQFLYHLEKLKERSFENEMTGDDRDDEKGSHRAIKIPIFPSNYDVAVRVQSIMYSQEDFDKLYLELLSAAARVYYNGGRRRFFHKMNGEIAAIRFRQQNYVEALPLLKGQLVHYMEDGWEELATDVRIRLAECQKMMDQRAEYSFSCISLLASRGLNDAQASFYKRELYSFCSNFTDENVAYTAGEIDFDHMHVVFQQPTYEITVVEIGESVTLSFDVHTTFCIDIDFDEVSLHFAPPLVAALSSISSTSATDTEQEEISENIVMSYGRFTAKSGEVGKIELSTTMIKLGEYALDRIVFRIAHVEFIVEYDALLAEVHQRSESVVDTVTQSEEKAIQLILRVVPSTPSLDIQALYDRCLFFDRLQSFSVTIDTMKDEVTSASLEIYAEDDCFHVGHGSEPKELTLHVRNDECETKRVINSTLINGKMELPTFQRNDKIEFKLPIRASRATKGSGTSGNFVVIRMMFALSYTKNTGEKFIIRRAWDLHFYKPFIYFYYVTNLANNITLLQVVVECTTPMPLNVLDYQFHIPEHYSQQLELRMDNNSEQYWPSADQRQNCILHNEESMSFVFHVNRKESTSTEQEYACQLELQYQPVLSDNPECDGTKPLTYTIDINWTSSPAVLFEVDCSFASDNCRNGRNSDESTTHLHVGQPVTMYITIRQMQWEIAHREMWYEISTDTSCWIMSGVKRRKFEIAASREDELNQQTFQCTMMSLVCGYVAMPKVHIMSSAVAGELDSGQVRQTYHKVFHHKGAVGNRIIVMPSKSANVCPMAPIVDNMHQENVVHLQSLQQRSAADGQDSARRHGDAVDAGAGGRIKQRTRSLPNDDTENDALSSVCNSHREISSSSRSVRLGGTPSMAQMRLQHLLHRQYSHISGSNSDSGMEYIDMTADDDELETAHDAVDDEDEDEISFVNYESVALNSSVHSAVASSTQDQSPTRLLPRLSVTPPVPVRRAPFH